APGELERVDTTTGARTVISLGGLIFNALGVAVDHDGSILVTNISDPGGGAGSIIRSDPTTGAQTLAYSGGELVFPYEPAVASNGDLYVTNFTAGPDFTPEVVRIAANAARNVISGNAGYGVQVNGSEATNNVVQ